MNYKLTKYTCYYSYLSMASIFALPPLLFVTFREMYGISYTLLGTLVLINFCTQLIIDLIFSFFTKYFNIHKTTIVMPLITAVGLLVYAIVPTVFPSHAYLGIALGTIICSIAAGLCEVLLSPIIAALPSDTPERDMSNLHSLYAYGVVLVVLISTSYFYFFGTHNWMWLVVAFAVLPVISSILYSVAPMPKMSLTDNSSNKTRSKKGIGIGIFFFCIFLGSAAENTMTNWISGYMEKALHISKTVGDILGLTLFAILLGFGRTLYGKYGKNIMSVLFISMAGSALCYLTAGFCNIPVIAMLACILNGLFTAMLWPGTLILMEEKIASPSVSAYALMAAGGDLGGSVAPQLLGIVVDTVAASSLAQRLSPVINLSCEQIGMKAGMLTTALFPFVGLLLLFLMKKRFNKYSKI